MRNNMTDKTEGKHVRILKKWQSMKEETGWKKKEGKEGNYGDYEAEMEAHI